MAAPRQLLKQGDDNEQKPRTTVRPGEKLPPYCRPAISHHPPMPEQDGRVYGKQRRRQSLRRVEAATAGLEQYMTPAKVLQHVHRLVDSYKQARLHLKRRANRRDKRKRRFLRHHGLDDYSRGSN